jgi:hypothetical protein
VLEPSIFFNLKMYLETLKMAYIRFPQYRTSMSLPRPKSLW